MNEQLKIRPFRSSFDLSFWQKLCETKLKETKLSEERIIIFGTYSYPYCDRAAHVYFDSSSFDMRQYAGSSTMSVQGDLVILNTLKSYIERCTDLPNNEYVLDSPDLIKFYMIVYADLKNYEFHYRCAYPTHKLKGPILTSYTLTNEQERFKNSLLLSNDKVIDTVRQRYEEFNENHSKQRFAIKISTLQFFSIKEALHLLKNNLEHIDDMVFCVDDPSMLIAHVAGWPVRQLLIGLSANLTTTASNITFLMTKKPFHELLDATKSINLCKIDQRNENYFKFMKLALVDIRSDGDLDQVHMIGFEDSNICECPQVETANHFGHYLDLRATLDPINFMRNSNLLNLEMMKWQMEPKMDLKMMSKQKCLLIGAGTLGCNVSRLLMAWSIDYLTFVDQAEEVSLSSPIRQSLYSYHDVVKSEIFEKKAKCQCACDACMTINPSITCKAVKLKVPCPGGGIASRDDLRQIVDLIKEHDVIFLLTDTRESRFIPTLIAKAYDKMCITVALGFDSALVIRHGLCNEIMSTQADSLMIKSPSSSSLACYFCSDHTTPSAKYQQDRTLDMQCTVSRPGLSMIASGYAVELLANACMAQTKAPAFTKHIPHSIRIFLSSFSLALPQIPAYEHCLACSANVITKFKESGIDFLTRVVEDPEHVQVVSGLAQHLANARRLIENDCCAGDDEDGIVILEE